MTKATWIKSSEVRDIIAHHYFKVDVEIVCDITQNGIDDLIVTTSKMLSEYDEK